MAKLKALLREPLTLFLILGVALFALDRMLNGAPELADDNTRIVVTAAQQVALREAFRAEYGREPQAAEIRTRLDRWVEEQVLYLEALSLNLDRKDLIVRRQLTQKMRFLLEDAGELPLPSDVDLQAWLDQHAEKYGQATTLSFEQVFLSRGEHGSTLQAEAEKIGALLAKSPDVFLDLGDPFPLGQVIALANHLQIRRDFGVGFFEALQALSPGVWSGPVPSSLGLHWVRVTGRTEFKPTPLADVRQRVLTDYQTAQHEQQTRLAIDRLKLKYRIEVEGVGP